MQSIDWDIFRYVVAVADSGSAVSAAEVLGVNASTVLRKISKFEEQNGIRLFERRQTGYFPTVECAAVVEAARQIEQCVAGISRDILGRDLRLEGRLTVTTTDTLLQAVLAPHIAAFRVLHPRIRIDISVTNTRLNLTRHDADVAIRASKKPPDTLVGQQVAKLAFAKYGLPEVVEGLPANPRIDDIKHLSWVGIGDTLMGSPVGVWINNNISPEAIAVTADTFVAVRDCALAGAGLAVLPCFLGDQTEGLRRIGAPVAEMQSALWILTHADVRSAARVKAFNEYMTRALRAQSDLLAGTSV
jgi:DNA-binding transcriptional LysR family regulator